jgi:hypothetical protein
MCSSIKDRIDKSGWCWLNYCQHHMHLTIVLKFLVCVILLLVFIHIHVLCNYVKIPSLKSNGIGSMRTMNYNRDIHLG